MYAIYPERELKHLYFHTNFEENYTFSSVKTFFAIYVDGSYCILCLGCFPVEGETALFFFAVLLLGLFAI